MYATSSDELDCAIEELRQMPHRGYVARVEAFLERRTSVGSPLSFGHYDKRPQHKQLCEGHN